MQQTHMQTHTCMQMYTHVCMCTHNTHLYLIKEVGALNKLWAQQMVGPVYIEICGECLYTIYNPYMCICFRTEPPDIIQEIKLYVQYFMAEWSTFLKLKALLIHACSSTQCHASIMYAHCYVSTYDLTSGINLWRLVT